jgi:predicted patatin/cPLA2 family phospholipase
VYDVEIYEDKDGNSELKDWLRELKHIIEDIWELRPDKYRVMVFQIKKAMQLRDDWNKRNY